MDEGRKRVIGVMAAILAARKVAQWDGGKRVPATVAASAAGPNTLKNTPDDTSKVAGFWLGCGKDSFAYSHLSSRCSRIA
jgi:hypothetical protein